MIKKLATGLLSLFLAMSAAAQQSSPGSSAVAPAIPGLVPMVGVVVKPAASLATQAGVGGASVPGIEAGASIGVPRGPSAFDSQPSKTVYLSPNEAAGVRLSDQWGKQTINQSIGEDGSLVVPFGEAMPAIVCAPLLLSTIHLQPGEVLNDIKLGDTVRWRYDLSTSGSGANKTTHINIKPIGHNLFTDMTLATDRRFYQIKLVSGENDQRIPSIRFSYPEESSEQLAHYQQTVQKTEERSVLYTGEVIGELDFDFKMSGDQPSWRPVRIYSDHSKTYIEFPKKLPEGEWPALVSLSKGDETKVVNYRTAGNRIIVDKVLSHAALVLGIDDDEQRVVIDHDVKGRQ